MLGVHAGGRPFDLDLQVPFLTPAGLTSCVRVRTFTMLSTKQDLLVV